MSKLQALLKYGFAGNSERSRMLSKEWFKNEIEGIRVPNPYTKEHDLIDAHALLQSERSAIQDSTLVQEEVYKTVLEGTEPVKCMREVIPIVRSLIPLLRNSFATDRLGG